MTAPPEQLKFGQVLKLPGISRLWAAQIVSVFGDFLAIFAVYSIITFQMHGTPNQVGLILVAYLLPLAFIGPIAGAFVDRWDVRTTMIASDLIRASLAVLLLFARDVSHFYLILFALSSVSSFFLPAQSVMVRTLVPMAGLMSANALMGQAVQVMQIVSPSISGAMVAKLGANSCFWFDIFSFSFSAAMVFTIRAHNDPVKGPATVRSIAASVAEGMKFIFTHSAVSFVILAMTAGMFAIRCFSALLAVYVRDVLHRGTEIFGNLSSLVGVGMIVGTQLINRFGKTRPKNQLVIAGLIGISFAILLVAALGSVAGTVIGMFGLGFCVAFIVIPAQTLMQQETPKTMLGRVSSSMWSVLSLAQVAAMLIAGPVAESIGIRNLYFGSGVLLLLMAGFGASQMHKRHEPEPAAAATSNQP